MRTETQRHRRQHLVLAGVFLAIALAQTWPLAMRLTTALPNDLGDPVLNTWILWWNAHAVPLTSRWWNAPMFYPLRGALAFSETLLGLAIFASPMQWLGASPVLAYNVLLILSFALSAFCAYLLAWRLTRRAGPSIVAGLIYGYHTYRYAQLPHIQTLWTWWMPLALLGLHVWMADRRKSGLVLFGAAWLGQSLSNGYYFFYFSVLAGLWLAWFIPWGHWRETRRTLLPALAAWIAAAALISPVMLGYRQIQQRYFFERTIEEIEMGSADLTEFFRPSSVPRLLHIERWEKGEHEVWLGFAGIAALAAAIVTALRYALSRRAAQAWRARSVTAFYLGSTIATIVLALGPSPKAFESTFWRAGPYSWLMAIVPGFTGVRVPARFTLVAILCLAILTALMLTRLRFKSIAGERLVFSTIALIVLLESWPGQIVMARLPPIGPDLSKAATVMEVPFTGAGQDVLALYRSMFHGRPVVNGYSGYEPTPHTLLRHCLSEQDDGCFTTLRQAVGPLHVVVDRRNDPGAIWEQFVRRQPGAQMSDRDGRLTIYYLPAPAPAMPTFAQPLVRVPIKRALSSAEPAAMPLAFDGNRLSSWSTIRGQQKSDRVVFEIEAAAPLAGIELWLEPLHYRDFPAALTIDTSEDGEHWTTAWSGPTPPVRAMTLFTDGIDGGRITFAPRSARFIRLTCTADDSTRAWSIAEATILRTQ